MSQERYIAPLKRLLFLLDPANQHLTRRDMQQTALIVLYLSEQTFTQVNYVLTDRIHFVTAPSCGSVNLRLEEGYSGLPLVAAMLGIFRSF